MLEKLAITMAGASCCVDGHKALGGQAQDILGLVLRQGIGAVLVGVAVGVVAALALTRLVSSLLFGVKPTDALTFMSVTAL